MIICSTQKKKSVNGALQKTTQTPPKMCILSVLVVSPVEGSMHYQGQDPQDD